MPLWRGLVASDAALRQQLEPKGKPASPWTKAFLKAALFAVGDPHHSNFQQYAVLFSFGR